MAIKDNPSNWHFVGQREHECGGRILAEVNQSAPPEIFTHDTPVECEKCGASGVILVDDGCVDFVFKQFKE